MRLATISIVRILDVTYMMENLYPEGSVITALEAPAKKLRIVHYIRRIYYCEPIDNPDNKLLPYFEKELIAPANA